MGTTKDVMDLGSVRDKLASFGLVAVDCNGHDEAALDDAFRRLRAEASPAPRALVAHTVKGHGVSFMAADNRWHYTRLDADTYTRAVPN